MSHANMRAHMEAGSTWAGEQSEWNEMNVFGKLLIQPQLLSMSNKQTNKHAKDMLFSVRSVLQDQPSRSEPIGMHRTLQ